LPEPLPGHAARDVHGDEELAVPAIVRRDVHPLSVGGILAVVHDGLLPLLRVEPARLARGEIEVEQGVVARRASLGDQGVTVSKGR
jgi:hypothetical protein